MSAEILQKYVSWPGHSVPPHNAVLHLAESNHRIANNLSLVVGMLTMKAREIEEQGTPLLPLAASELLIEAAAKIQVVADLHRLLSRDGEQQVDLGGYLEQIGEAVMEALGQDRPIAFHTALDVACTTSADRASALGLMVNELLINALKYAHPAQKVSGRIDLGCYRDHDGTLIVRVSDDGVGLPDHVGETPPMGLGMRTLRALAKKVDATLEFDSSSLGLTVLIKVGAD